MLVRRTTGAGGLHRARKSRQHAYRPLRFEPLECRTVLDVSLAPLAAVDLPASKHVFVPLQAADGDQLPVDFTVTSSNSNVTAQIVTGGRSLVLNVSGRDSDGTNFSGNLVMRLFEDRAPQTVARIVEIVESGFWIGSDFHRVIDDFVAQGGGLPGNPNGDTGFDSIDDERDPTLTFESFGMVGLAKAEDDSVTTQFFIVDTELGVGGGFPTHLNYVHTIVGQLTGGFDTLRKIMRTPKTNDVPNTPVVINAADIFVDTQNGVLELSAASGVSGTSQITVTARNARGESIQRQFTTTVEADTVNDAPFLNSIENQFTHPGAPITISLDVFDLENDTLTFVAQDGANFGASVSNATVTFNTVNRTATITPVAGFTGVIDLQIGVRDNFHGTGTTTTPFDIERFTVTVTSAPLPPTALDLVAESDTGASNADNFTTDATPTITVRAEAGKTVEIRSGTRVLAMATEQSPGVYSATLPAGSLAIGVNSLTAVASDSAGTSQASTALEVTFAPELDNLYVVPGAVGQAVQVTFDWTFRAAAYDNEIGIFLVDDLEGSIGDLKPGDRGYAEAALGSDSQQVIFTSGQAAGATKTVTLNGGEIIAFYLVRDNTTEAVLGENANNESRRNGALAYFSFKAANPDGIEHVHAASDAEGSTAEYHWEDLLGGGDRDYNDVVFTVRAASGIVAGEAVRVPGGSSSTTEVDFGLEPAGDNAAPLDGEVGIFRIDSADGKIGNLNPGDDGYLQAALTLARRQTLFVEGDTIGATQSLDLPGGYLFGFYRTVGGTANQVLALNPDNVGTTSPYALFSFAGGNPDDGDHFRWFEPESTPRAIPTENDALRLRVLDALVASDDFDDVLMTVRFVE